MDSAVPGHPLHGFQLNLLWIIYTMRGGRGTRCTIHGRKSKPVVHRVREYFINILIVWIQKRLSESLRLRGCSEMAAASV